MTDSSKQPTFEESLRRLEEIVSLLDGGKADLETSLAYYEEGVKLLRRCRTTLSDAEQRIEILKKGDASGELVTEAVNPDSFRSTESTPGRQTEASVAATLRGTSSREAVSEVGEKSAANVKPKRTRSAGGGKSRAAKPGGSEETSAGKDASPGVKEAEKGGDADSAPLPDVSGTDVSGTDVSGADASGTDVAKTDA